MFSKGIHTQYLRVLLATFITVAFVGLQGSYADDEKPSSETALVVPAKLSPLAQAVERLLFKRVPSIAGTNPLDLKAKQLTAAGVTPQQVELALIEVLTANPGYFDTISKGHDLQNTYREELDAAAAKRLEALGVDVNAPRDLYVAYRLFLNSLNDTRSTLITQRRAEQRGWIDFRTKGYETVEKGDIDAGRYLHTRTEAHTSDEEFARANPGKRKLMAWRDFQVRRIDAARTANAKTLLQLLGNDSSARKLLPSSLRKLSQAELEKLSVHLDDQGALHIEGGKLKEPVVFTDKQFAAVLDAPFPSTKKDKARGGEIAPMLRLWLLDPTLREASEELNKMDFRKSPPQKLTERLQAVAENHRRHRSTSEAATAPQKLRELGPFYIARMYAGGRWNLRSRAATLNPFTKTFEHAATGKGLRPGFWKRVAPLVISAGLLGDAYVLGKIYKEREMEDATTRLVDGTKQIAWNAAKKVSPLRNWLDPLQSHGSVFKNKTAEAPPSVGKREQALNLGNSRSQSHFGSKEEIEKSRRALFEAEQIVGSPGGFPDVIEIAAGEDFDDAKLKPITEVPEKSTRTVASLVPITAQGKYVPIPLLRGDRLAEIGVYTDNGTMLEAGKDFDLYETAVGAPVAILARPEDHHQVHVRTGSTPADKDEYQAYFDPHLLETIRKELGAAGFSQGLMKDLSGEIEEAIADDRYVPAIRVTEMVRKHSDYIFGKTTNPNLANVPADNFYRKQAEQLDEKGCYGTQCSGAEELIERIHTQYNQLSGGLEMVQGTVVRQRSVDGYKAVFGAPLHIQEYLRQVGDDVGIKEVHDATPPERGTFQVNTSQVSKSPTAPSAASATQSASKTAAAASATVPHKLTGVKTAPELKRKEEKKTELPKKDIAAKPAPDTKKQSAPPALTPAPKIDEKNLAFQILIQPPSLKRSNADTGPAEPRSPADRPRRVFAEPTPDAVAAGSPPEPPKPQRHAFVADPRSIAALKSSLKAMQGAYVSDEMGMTESPRKRAIAVGKVLLDYAEGKLTFEDFTKKLHWVYPNAAALPSAPRYISEALRKMAEETDDRLRKFREIAAEKDPKDLARPAQASTEYADTVREFYDSNADRSWELNSRVVRPGEPVDCEVILVTLAPPPSRVVR